MVIADNYNLIMLAIIPGNDWGPSNFWMRILNHRNEYKNRSLPYIVSEIVD